METPPVSDEGKMTFLEHLEELRKRLIIIVISIFVGMLICWFFREQILSFLVDPLYVAWRQVDGLPEPKPLNFSSMLEPFIAYLKLSALGGLFVASPIVLLQIWKFVAPGLYPREKRLAIPFVVVSTLLFVVGSTMAYKIVFPIGFQFFLNFAAGREMTEIESEVTVAPTAVFKSSTNNTLKMRSHQSPKTHSSQTILDAGTDGSVEIGENDTPATNGNTTWTDSLLGYLFSEECATFRSIPSSNESGVDLILNWHKARCGATPDILKVKRDGEIIDLLWKEDQSKKTGYLTLIARDVSVTRGKHTYMLAFPTNPSENRLAPVLMVKDYLSLSVRILLAFGIIFELPIFISFLSIAGVVNYKQLLSFSRYFLVISVVVGAMLTPPDVITQLLLAMPLMVLYFASIVVAYFLGPKPD